MAILFSYMPLIPFLCWHLKTVPTMYHNLRKLLFFPLLLTVLIVTSCQREIDFTGINPVTEYVKDSTLLIKSVTSLWDNGQDSIVENYSYDSINRKITLTWNDPSSSNIQDGTIAEFSYNNNWMISHAQYIYPAGYLPQAGEYTTIDILYDAEKTLQKITVNYGDGSSESKVYSKTLLPSGNYRLSWDESDPGYPFFRRAEFNADGRNITSIVDYSYVAETTPAGDDVFTNVIVTDSLFYDASGSLRKIIRNEVDTLRHTNQSYVSYDFSTRLTRGDQLYNQRQAIMNGIANMPFFDPDSNADLFGVLTFSLENEQWQYLKYPVQTADMRWLGNNYHFTGSSEFDTMNRLIKFKGFLLDLGLTEGAIKIKYYK